MEQEKQKQNIKGVREQIKSDLLEIQKYHKSQIDIAEEKIKRINGLSDGELQHLIDSEREL